MALIITLPQAVTGSLTFPTISKWGINVPAIADSYFDRLDTAEHSWTAGQLSAWKAFVATGQNDGWLAHILSCYPFFGTTGEQARIPFIGALTDNALLKAITGSDWDAAFLVANGLRRGIRGGAAGLSAVDPTTLQQTITKATGFANQAANVGGRLYVVRNNGTKGNLQMGGSGKQTTSGDYNGFFRSLTPWSEYAPTAFHRNFPNVARGAEGSVDYVAYGVSSAKDYRYFGTEAAAAWIEAANTPPTTTATNPTLIEHGVNCLRYNSSGETFATPNGVAESVTEWAQLDDGAINTETMQSSMRVAVATLRTALYA